MNKILHLNLGQIPLRQTVWTGHHSERSITRLAAAS